MDYNFSIALPDVMNFGAKQLQLSAVRMRPNLSRYYIPQLTLVAER